MCNFASELQNLRSQLPLAKLNKILPLSPILNSNPITVEACICHPNILEQNKHQIILANHITSIFVTQFHKKHQEAKLLQLLENNFGLLMGNQ